MLLTLSLALSFSFLSFGQAVIFSDDFEGYVVGQQVACQNPTQWTTWSNLPCDPTEDPVVSSTYAHGGSNSVHIISFSTTAGNDLVREIPDYTTGKYKISFYMYIPADHDGYFNVLQDFAGASSQWGLQVYFYAGGTGNMDAGAALISPFTFTHDTWMFIEVVVDLDNDVGEIYLNSTLLHSWIWHTGTFGTGTLNQLGGVDMFGYDDETTTGTGEYYFDDFMITDLIVPVELTSFTASVNDNGNVVLDWSTATETNNNMFEIERRVEQGEFFTIGYVNGAGTTTEPQNYSYTDKTTEAGKYFYRLKQIDFDGRFEYSDEVEVDVVEPVTFNLKQNYPNPFNPTTNINYSVPEAGNVRLSVYNTVGEEIAVLVNGYSEAGRFNVTFDASNLPSGVYLYKLQSANIVQTKKMMLLK